MINIDKTSIDDSNYISFKQYKTANGNKTNIIFLHGLLSDMNGSKSEALLNFCIENQLNYLTFDNLGHGISSGNFTEQTITSWLVAAKFMIENLGGEEVILVASSKGGWLALLLAQQYISSIKGVVLLAPAPDFTENIWSALSLAEQHQMIEEGIFNFKKPHADYIYPISYDLILDGKKYLLLDKTIINLSAPTIIIQGMQDLDVSYENAITLSHKIEAPYFSTKLLKYSGHRLADPLELEVIFNSIKEIIKINNTILSS